MADSLVAGVLAANPKLHSTTRNFRFADKPFGKNPATQAYRLGPNSRLDSSLSALISFSEITLKSAAASMFSGLVALVEPVIHLRRFSS
jgi:hypothetical protein